MNTITLTALRSNLAKTIDKVVEDNSHVIVTRAKSKPVVILSLEDFASYEETAYLLGNPHNAKNLVESIEQLKEGKGKRMTIKQWRERYRDGKNK